MTALSGPEYGVPPLRDTVLGGRYRLQGPLGSGGTADVFHGVDEVLGREVAVKVFRAGTDTVTADRFCDEARTLARLSHPALVTVFDAGRHGQGAFMVTELIRGVTLRTRMDAGPLGPVQVMRIGADISSALDHVHAHGVIHHDVKPSNILLGEEGSPHLADFGLSRTVHERTRSAPDTLVGTVAYMAPEQFLGEGASTASDIYALGVTLLEALTGRREYQGTPMEIGTAHLLRRPHIPEGLPEDLARLLARMTDYEPAARPDAAAVHQCLQDMAKAPRRRTPVGATPHGTTTHRSPFSPAAAAAVPTTDPGGAARGRRPLWWTLAATSLAGTCVLVMGGMQAGNNPPATAPTHEQPEASKNSEVTAPTGSSPAGTPAPPLPAAVTSTPQSPAAAPSTPEDLQKPTGPSSVLQVAEHPSKAPGAAKAEEIPGKAKGRKGKGR
ncbi:serine/threonine-protein kinase [Streptomyces sp. NRRL F-2664]|uniref:serine/threonine-protein kinase n=1 Tax=Streptomyces sp. NRRL F-2664 TaxID=1463842 RepID=UPI000691A08B|nr:serine/threonine-protein kinase [Streptomyces sp. NRRL F-2664]